MAQDDKMKLGITLDVDANGTELIDALQRKVNALAKSMAAITANMRKAAQAVSLPGRSATSNTDSKAEVRSARDLLALDRASVAEFRRKLTLKTRMAAQHAKEERDSLKAYKDRVSFQSRATAQAEREEARSVQNRMKDEAQAFRQRFAFGTRMGRQAVQEEKARAREAQRSIAETARADAQRMRERAAELRDGHRREIAETRRHEREIARHESARHRGYADLRSGGSDTRQGLSRATMGAAVISGAGTAAAGSAARRGISTRMETDTAETNLRIFSGQTTEQIKAARRGFLDNEAIKNGLGIAGGLNTYNEVLKAGIKSPELNTKTIMQAVSALELDLASTTKLAGLLDRNFGASSTPAKLKSALNAVAISAREDPTNAGEIVEGVKRGFGALSTGNMTPEQLTALVSGVQSVGVQPGKAGTFIATLGKQLSMGSSKFLGKKNRDELNFAAKELGFSDARQMAKTYTNDSYATIVKLNERLNAMEAGKRTNVAEALMGRQWSDETLQNAQGVEGQKKTYSEIISPGSANFLEEAARQRAESLQGQWNSTKSIFNRFWDSFGAGFEDILTSINKYFLDLNSSFDYDKIKGYVVSFFDGVKDALGVKTWQELLHNTFGGNLGNYGQQIRDFGKGLTEGVMGFVRGVRSVFEVFAGSNASAETIGKFAGQFVALTAALVISGPAIALLNGIGLAVMGIATVALGAWRILRAAGLVGATGLGSAPKIAETPGKGIGRLGGRLGAAGAAAGFAGTSSLSKAEQDALSKRLGSWAQDREKLSAPSTPWVDVPPKAVEELKEAIQENSLIHKQSFEAENGFRGLIHKASLSTTAPAESVKAAMSGAAGSIQAAMSGSIGGSSVSGGPLSTSVPGSSLGGGSGLSRRGILGGGGGAAASGPIRDRMKSVYDAYRSAGLSHESAKSFAAEIGRENDFNPKLMFGSHIDPHNGKRNAGMMSWQGDRATKLLDTLRAGGHLNSDGSIKQTQESLNAQAKFSLDEMKNGALGAKGQRALGVLQNPNATHADRALALGDDVIKWRQHDPRYASHANKRDRYYNQMEGVSSGASAGIGATSTSGQVLSQMQTLRRSGQVMNEQCVALAKAAVGATGSVQDWKKGESAELGNLKPGTPVATFLDRMGRQTAKYAGGGTGTPGANLDHAGVFQEYIKDAAGKNIGMRLAEQYKGSGGVRSKDYMFGKGFGEKNASNYSTIMGPDGNYLGGSNNPMSRIAKQAEEIKSSGWRKGSQTGETPNAFGGSSNALSAPVRQEKLFNPGKAGGANTGNGGGGSGGNATIHINGQNLDAHSIANAVQRRWNENVSRGTHDIDSQSL